MKTEHIMKHLSRMPGYIEVSLGWGDSRQQLRLNNGRCSAETASILQIMHGLVEGFRGITNYLHIFSIFHIRHWPTGKGRSFLYSFYEHNGQWTPHCAEVVRYKIQMLQMKNCRPAVMEE
jgi:hypothetical protein